MMTERKNEITRWLSTVRMRRCRYILWLGTVNNPSTDVEDLHLKYYNII
jgi:hypothetical protein